MNQTNLAKMLDVIQSHRVMVNELEHFLKNGEVKKASIAVKGLALTAAFMEELLAEPAVESGPGALKPIPEAKEGKPEN